VYANVALDLTGSLPEIQLLPPALDGAGADQAQAYFENPANYFWRSAMDHIEDSEGDENAGRLDFDRKFDNDGGWMDSVRFGVRYSERDQTTRWSTYNWGRLSEIWGNNGPVWFDEGVDGVPSSTTAGPAEAGPNSEANVSIFPFANFMRGDVVVPALPPYWTANVVQNYADSAASFRQINQEWESATSTGGWFPLDQRPVGDLMPGTPFRPNEVNHVTEDTGALYLQFNFGHEFSDGKRIAGNIGLRYIDTDVGSDGFQVFPTGSGLQTEQQCADAIANAPPGQNIPPFCVLTPEERQSVRNYSNAASVPLNTQHNYHEVLPSLNVKLNVTDDMLVRFGYSRAINRASMGLMRSYLTQTAVNERVDPGNPNNTQEVFAGYTGESGNPTLEPMNDVGVVLRTGGLVDGRDVLQGARRRHHQRLPRRAPHQQRRNLRRAGARPGQRRGYRAREGLRNRLSAVL
jgi:TonB-dependent receptor